MILVQRPKYSSSMPAFNSGPMSLAQVSSWRAEWTVRVDLSTRLTRAKIVGASSWTLWPSSHRSSQNKVDWPLPTVERAATLNSWRASSGTFMRNSDHEWEGSDHWSQGHRAWNAIFSHCKLGKPRPTAHLGEQTESQATAHWPPEAWAFADHKNPRQILFMAEIVFLGKSRASIAWKGIAHSTNWIRSRRPLFGILVAFHLGRAPANCYLSLEL